MANTRPEPRATTNRSTVPMSDMFKHYVANGWAARTDPVGPPRPQALFAARRREKIGSLYPGKRLIIPAGSAKVRSNDTDFPYRAHSAFAHLTGWGADSEPDSVLVLEPSTNGHQATVYFRERASRDSDEFYANPQIGEFWIGPRPSLAQVAGDLGLATRSIAELEHILENPDGHSVQSLIVRDADRDLTDRVDRLRIMTLRAQNAKPDLNASPDKNARVNQSGSFGFVASGNPFATLDKDLARDLSELRLVKDDYEIAELRLAVAATKQGFDDVIADLPAITAHPRGERLVEGTFNRRARAEGNTVGYDTIAAAGPHACILHWTRNDGPVKPGDMILLDAGIELDSYYTADITRTLPVNGRFSPVQSQVYEAVLQAADAAFAIVKPGIRFRDIHAAAMAVIAEKTAEWGILPASAEESMKPENQYHRRYMVHGTSHHLGLDVHDCAQARRELYLDGILEAGMVFTIEPGLYFQPDDLTVPPEFRGIGVRIEDNILVTANGAENLSIDIPRTTDDVEHWLADQTTRNQPIG